MADQVIISRTIGGLDDRQLSLARGTAARKIGAGSDWSIMRLGFRMNVVGSGDIVGAPVLALGMCKGTTNKYADPTTDHFVGFRTGLISEWTEGGGYYYILNGAWEAVKRVGSTDTASGALTFGVNGDPGGSTGWTYMFNDSIARRTAWFLQFEKGSPWTIKILGTGASSSDDTTIALLNAGMEASTWLSVAGAAYSTAPYGTETTMAVDEGADGALDAVNMYWNQTNFQMAFSDVMWRKVA